MTSTEYANLVAEIARQYVSENKPLHRTLARIAIKSTPMAILANSLREPTEDQLLEVIERYNPFAAVDEDITDELRTRYTAICKLQLDVNDAIVKYREERLLPITYRILDLSTGKYLTWAEADPNLEVADDDVMAEYTSREEAETAAETYARVMNSIQASTELEVVVFNRYHERILP